MQLEKSIVVRAFVCLVPAVILLLAHLLRHAGLSVFTLFLRELFCSISCSSLLYRGLCTNVYIMFLLFF